MNCPPNSNMPIQPRDLFFIPPPPPNTRSHQSHSRPSLSTDSVSSLSERKVNRPVSSSSSTQASHQASPIRKDSIQGAGVDLRPKPTPPTTSSANHTNTTSPVAKSSEKSSPEKRHRTPPITSPYVPPSVSATHPPYDEHCEDESDDDAQGLLDGSKIILDEHPTLAPAAPSRSSSSPSVSSSSSSPSDDDGTAQAVHQYRSIGDDETDTQAVPRAGYSLMQDSEWQMSKDQWRYYSSLFHTLLSASQALDSHLLPIQADMTLQFFRKSQLIEAELRHILALADMDLDEHLSLHEFNVAMHLVVMRKKDYPLPDRVPVLLLQGPIGISNVEGDERPVSAARSDSTVDSSASSSSNDSNSEAEASEDVHILKEDDTEVPYANLLDEEMLAEDDNHTEVFHNHPQVPPVIPPRTAASKASVESPRSSSSGGPGTFPGSATISPPPRGNKVITRPVPRPEGQHQDYHHHHHQHLMRQSNSDQQVVTLALGSGGSSGRGSGGNVFGKLVVGSASSTALSSSTKSTSLVGEETHLSRMKAKQKLQASNERRELLAKIRALRQRNHVLLRLNNELNHEYQEIQGQSHNLEIRLRHLQSLAANSNKYSS